MNDNDWLGRMPRKIVLYYLIFSGLWVYFSNTVLHYFVRDVEMFLRIATYKGWAFIAATAVCLYMLLKRYISMIREREQNYQTLADSGQALVWLAGTDKLCTYFNKTWLDFTGRTREQELGNGWAEGVHPADLQRCLDVFVGSFGRREKFSREFRLRRHDGEYRWLQDDGCPRYDSAGEFIGYIGYCLDITESKQLEVELAKNSEFMAAILDSIEDGVLACDKDGVLNLFNRTTRQFTPEYELRPVQWNEYFKLYEPDGVTRMPLENIPLYRALQGEVVNNQEMLLVLDDASSHLYQTSGRQIVDHKGVLLGAFVTMHDVTMVKTLEEHLRQSQKMESIGTLAGGVAHDFNNLLTVIMGACTLLEMNAADDPEHMKFITQIRNSSERAARLTQSLLAFSRKQTICKESEDLNSVIRNVHDFLERIIGQDVRLTTTQTGKPLVVMIDCGQIEQVLMNLAANARDAMPHGGTLNIALSQLENPGALLELEGCRAGDYALMTVSDSGEGIDKNIRQRIFEPFFTTKELGKGTGLGLSMAYGIVRQHDGAIHVSSEPGEGTTFRIYLPLRDQNSRDVAVTPVMHLPGGTETILLVEDDPEVLAINKGILERAGYLVLSALDGVEALQLFRRRSGEISLVVLDVIMNGMNGKEVYTQLKACKYDVKVLFASGYTADILTGNGVIQERINFISKPFNPALLLGRVRTLINA